MFQRRLLIWVVLIVSLASACRPAAVGDAPLPEAGLLKAGIYRVSTGESLDLEGLTAALGGHRFIIVGESHDDRWHHEVQHQVYGALVAASASRRAGPLALGMEMFQQPYQNVLDAYVAGEIDEETMLDETGWDANWGFDPAFYEGMWRLARERGYPVIALNIPREIVRAVGRGGVESLDEDVREGLPELDLSNEAYRDYLRGIFAHHGMTNEGGLEFFYQAQVLWDEAMAARAVAFMRDTPQVEAMVILAGRGHVERGWGIPSRIERRIEGDAGVVTLVPVTIGSEHQKNRRRLDYLQGEAIADYVWIGELTGEGFTE